MTHTPSTIAAPVVDAFATYADLTPDQRERFGPYIQAKDEARSRMEATRAANARAAAALKAAGGDPQKALAIRLAGGV